MPESFEFLVLDADYVIENGRSVVRLWGTQDGKVSLAVDRKFEPYFYVQHKDNLNKTGTESLIKRILETEINGRRPSNVETVERKLFSKPGKFLRITVAVPADVPALRNVLKEWDDVKEEYEYDISFYRRYLIDKDITPMTWVSISGKRVETDLFVDSCFEIDSMKKLEKTSYPRIGVLAFDMETIREDGEDRIIMISLEDSEGFNRVLTYKAVRGPSECIEVVENERRMIERFIDVVRERDPYIITGYNTDGFDFPLLQQRCDRLGLSLNLGRDDERVIFSRRVRSPSAKVMGRVHIDIYSFIAKTLSPNLTSEVLSLDKVAKEILGVGKKELDWKVIQRSWNREEGIADIVNYCMHDSKITLLLTEHLLPQIYELSRITNQTIFDVSRMTYSQLVEWLLMKHAYSLNEMIPNRPKYDEITRRRQVAPYAGGYVHQPKEGIHDGIALFDFRSLYPSIIVSHNISPETLDCSCCRGSNQPPGSEHWFCRKRRGLIPGIIQELVERRVEVKKALQKQCDAFSSECKRLDNEQFALKILANASYGYFGYAGSRWYSRVCATLITAWGRHYIQEVIGKAEKMGFEVLYGDTDSLFLRMEKDIDKERFLREANRKLPGIMHLEFKDLYKRGIFIEAKTGLAAKKKYALLDRNDRLVMRGMETRRRDWSAIAKETQEKVVLAVLRDKTPDNAVKYVHETITSIRKGTVAPEKLVIYTQITKPLKEYEQIGPHVSAARKMINQGRSVNPGDVIEYVVTRGPGSISDRAEPAGTAKDYDPEYYIKNQVVPSAMRILSSLGVTEEQLLEKKDQSSLDEFMRQEHTS